MADEFDETIDAPLEPGERERRLPVDPVAVPGYRPRSRTRRSFWFAFVLALSCVALLTVLIAVYA